MPANTDPIFAAPVTNPFGIASGGFSLKPVLADIDGDGDLDLFVGQGGGSTVFYRNTGSAKLPAFALDVQGNLGLTSVGFKASPWLVDIDGDGDLDAFIGNNLGTTQFFRNTGSRTLPAFTPEMGNFGLQLLATSSTTLVFADIDSDGDQDAFIGNSLGVTGFFRNTGSASAPAFALEPNSFGLPDVGFSAAPAFADVDADGDLDAFIGNSDGTTQFYRNTGSAAAPAFAAASSNFGITSVTSQAGPTLADIDADGDLDAFVGIGTGGGIQFFENTAAGVALTQSGGRTAVTEGGATDAYTVVLNRAPTADVTITLDNTNRQITLSTTSLTFTTTNWNVAQTVTVTAVNDTVGEGAHSGAIRHTVTSADTAYDGLPLKPLTVRVADNDLPVKNPIFGIAVPGFFGLADAGDSAAPTFADIDNDGDLDAFVGRLNATPQFYRNIGSATAPSFSAEGSNFGITGNGTFSKPTLVDIDGDGDLDAFVGLPQGNTLYFENTGNANAPVFAERTSNFGITNKGYFASPAFADIDGDDDLDVFLGVSTGVTHFFRNTGSVNAPRFTPEAGNFGLASVGASASPSFADIDGDGDLDAFVGDQFGDTNFFLNSGSRSTPSFTSESSNFGIAHVGQNAVPSFADIDADGDLDAIVGNADGLTQFFLNPRGVQFAQTGTGTGVTEGGTGDSYTVVLKAAPTANVTITLTSSHAQVSTDATLLTFTPANWDVAQTVYVSAADDSVGEGAHSAAIRHTVTSADPAYSGMSLPPVTVQVADNDLPLQDASFGSPVVAAFGLVNVGGASATPVFADIDADGDMDAFVGVADGSTVFLRNTGTASTPSFVVEANNNFGLTDPGFGDYAAPALVDVDGDGDWMPMSGSRRTRHFSSGTPGRPRCPCSRAKRALWTCLSPELTPSRPSLTSTAMATWTRW